MVDAEERELEQFREEVRGWIGENFPAELRTHDKQEEFYQGLPRYPEGPDFKLWKDRVVDKGWGTPGWPTQYGGAGLPTPQARAVLQEFVAAGAYNPVAGMGTTLLGPTLLEYGNDEQKLLHLNRISRGEVRWCQGYSEPGAGSDLASLQTKAEDKGDHYLVNGQKIWTSGSLWAQWCFCLVRTDPTVKHDGISFLLIDMSTPGVEVRPIEIISGQSPFSEVFFTDVTVPKENLVGKLNAGWTIAKRLLQFERNAVNNNRRQLTADPRPIDEIAKEYVGVDEEGRIADPDLRGRIIKHMMAFKSLTLMQQRMLDETKAGQGPSEFTSVAKNARAHTQQEREELLVEIMGYQGLGWEGGSFSQTELDTTRAFLSNKAMSIYSGTSEVQYNIVAKRVLGLRDHQ
ncbi:MAG: acyl-CoA dehydrogenase family protein [Gammaproteobacteria bacterium]|nr:acyl-CoA dehydrogenase family protein [Gammaproteobacteria bacterium]